MKKLRIRSLTNSNPSKWLYLQEEETVNAGAKPAAEIPAPFTLKSTMNIQAQKRTNQYGRFRYSDLQYGKIEAALRGGLELPKGKIRIRALNGEWVYINRIEMPGDARAVRIRTKNVNDNGPWVYIQFQEV